jgi:hypothetical protein
MRQDDKHIEEICAAQYQQRPQSRARKLAEEQDSGEKVADGELRFVGWYEGIDLRQRDPGERSHDRECRNG